MLYAIHYKVFNVYNSLYCWILCRHVENKKEQILEYVVSYTVIFLFCSLFLSWGSSMWKSDILSSWFTKLMTLSLCCQITIANKHKLTQKKSLNRAVNWKKHLYVVKEKIKSQSKQNQLVCVLWWFTNSVVYQSI